MGRGGLPHDDEQAQTSGSATSSPTSCLRRLRSFRRAGEWAGADAVAPRVAEAFRAGAAALRRIAGLVHAIDLITAASTNAGFTDYG